MNTKIKTVHGTTEWANKNINISKGCLNNCKYCYANSMGVRFKQHAATEWQHETITYNDSPKYDKLYDGRIMFPSTHDITPNTINATIDALERLLSSGNKILIVTKPRFECVKSLCDKFDLYKEQITFRFTIGSVNNEVLSFWEPNAPSFEERLETLVYAFYSGFKTSSSIEPFLDNEVEILIETLRPYITDSIWIGKANQLRLNLTNNGYNDLITKKRADNLIELYSTDYKFDLYNTYKNDPLIKWKDSLKKDFQIPLLIEAGLDE